MEYSEYKNTIDLIKIGKHLPDSIYLHESSLKLIHPSLSALIELILPKYNIGNNKWNVIKFYKNAFKISLLDYPDFYNNAFPSLKCSHIIDFETSTYKKRQYNSSKNPPILHRKETLLDPSDPLIPIYQKLTAQAENEGLFEKKRIIGFRNNWEKILKEKGLLVVDHKIVKEDIPVNEIQRHKTAIDRYSLSTPVQSLYRHNYLNGGYTFFDYGCGKGDDLNIVKELGVTASGWDPMYRIEGEVQKADMDANTAKIILLMD